MKLRSRYRTSLTVAEATRRVLTMSEHRVPFTSVQQTESISVATTRLGPIRFEDRMRIVSVERSGPNLRALIMKEGPVLYGRINSVAIEGESGTIVGWEHDLHLPIRALTPVLGVVMEVGYRIGITRLLKRR